MEDICFGEENDGLDVVEPEDIGHAPAITGNGGLVDEVDYHSNRSAMSSDPEWLQVSTHVSDNVFQNANFDGYDEGNDEGNDEEQHAQLYEHWEGRDDWEQPPADSDFEYDHTHQKPSQVFNEVADLRNVTLQVGTQFKNASVFRMVLKYYAADNGFNYHFTKNNSAKIGVICTEKGCGFYIWCSAMQNNSNMQIKHFIPNHTCGRVMENNRRLTSDFIAERYLTHIKDTTSITIDSLQKKIQRDLFVKLPEQRIYRAIRRAKEKIQGNVSKQYNRLQDYCAAIQKSNPFSKAKVQVEYDETKTPRFLRLYIRYGAQKQGFVAGCRPFVGLDGCHLNGVYGGQLLAAVARDANDGMFPIAFAVVEQEKKESWKWFLQELFDDFGGPEDRDWVFISDKQKGLVELFKEWIPRVEHRYCMRHMYENFYKDFKGEELKTLLWKCAQASTRATFEKTLDEVTKLDPKASAWLKSRPPEEWCKAFFSEVAKTKVQVNSLCECFNSWIKDCRDKPIVTMCEMIRKKLMNRFSVRRTELDKYPGPICPDIQLMLEYNKKESRNCFAAPCGDGYYEVGVGEDNFTVHVPTKTCSCRDWQLDGIPCKHAIAALVNMREKPEMYVSSYYYPASFKAIYAGIILPVPGMSEWPTIGEHTIQPPIVQKPPGRPRYKRKKGVTEKLQNPYKLFKTHTEITCSVCKGKGHNARTCDPKKYGETAKQRKTRNKNAKKQEVVPPSADTMVDVIEKKRESVVNKLKKNRKAPTEAQPEIGGKNCTPDEIEQKRLAAMSRMEKKRKEREEQQTTSEPPQSNWVCGINRTKKQKLTMIRKEMKKATPYESNIGSTLPQISTEVPNIGIAQTEYNNARNHEWTFHQLQSEGINNNNGKERGKGLVESSSSRFVNEARFTTISRGRRGGGRPRGRSGGRGGSNTQPPLMARDNSQIGAPTSSQP